MDVAPPRIRKPGEEKINRYIEELAPERVAAVEAVAEFLNERLRPGETLLVSHSSCVGLHYLTGTRPALSAAWLSERYRPAYYEQLVADMVAADRVPRYYVSTAQHTARLGNPGCPSVPSTDKYTGLQLCWSR